MMKLPDFLEELNQGAEEAFGDNAQKMIDGLLYANLPTKVKIFSHYGKTKKRLV